MNVTECINEGAKFYILSTRKQKAKNSELFLNTLEIEEFKRGLIIIKINFILEEKFF